MVLNAENINNLPQSFTTKRKIKCTEEESKLVIEHLSTEFPNADNTDGIKVVIDEKNWIMVRKVMLIIVSITRMYNILKI